MKTREQLEQAVSILMAIGLSISAALFTLSIVYMYDGDKSGEAFAMLAVFALVATPVIRVLLCLRHFTHVRDWKYIALTVWVLLAMILGVVFGAT